MARFYGFSGENMLVRRGYVDPCPWTLARPDPRQFTPYP